MDECVDTDEEAYAESVGQVAQALRGAFEALMGGDAVLARARLAELSRSQRDDLFMALDLLKSIVVGV